MLNCTWIFIERGRVLCTSRDSCTRVAVSWFHACFSMASISDVWWMKWVKGRWGVSFGLFPVEFRSSIAQIHRCFLHRSSRQTHYDFRSGSLTPKTNNSPDNCELPNSIYTTPIRVSPFSLPNLHTPDANSISISLR
jgi:hypothetical protein